MSYQNVRSYFEGDSGKNKFSAYLKVSIGLNFTKYYYFNINDKTIPTSS